MTPKEIRLPDLRSIRVDPYLFDLDPSVLTKHRRVVSDGIEGHYRENFGFGISLDPEIEEWRWKQLESLYPNFGLALWFFERAPRNCQIYIHELNENFYRKHAYFSYSMNKEPAKKAMLKQTHFARSEKMMARINRALGLPSYKVFSVDGRSDFKSFFELIDTGKRTKIDDYTIPVERVVPVLPSQYAVVEFVPGMCGAQMLGRLDQYPCTDQEIFLKNFGKIRACEYLFSIMDYKEEHLVVDSQMQITRIDLEHILNWFSKEFYFDRNSFLRFGSSIDPRLQDELVVDGITQLLDQLRTNWHQVAGIVERSSNFGVVSASGKIQPQHLHAIERQAVALERWLNFH